MANEKCKWCGANMLTPAGNPPMLNTKHNIKECEQKTINEVIAQLGGIERARRVAEEIPPAIRFLKTLPLNCMGRDHNEGFFYRDEMIYRLSGEADPVEAARSNNA